MGSSLHIIHCRINVENSHIYQNLSWCVRLIQATNMKNILYVVDLLRQYVFLFYVGNGHYCTENNTTIIINGVYL